MEVDGSDDFPFQLKNKVISLKVPFAVHFQFSGVRSMSHFYVANVQKKIAKAKLWESSKLN